MEPTDDMMEAAADALYAVGGIDIRMPWQCSLDDLEQSRYEALRKALAAVLRLAPRTIGTRS